MSNKIKAVAALCILGILLPINVSGQKCKNEYRDVLKIKYGRQARVIPDRDVYYPDDVLRFVCPKGFKFQSSYYQRFKGMWITCLRVFEGFHRWDEHWPICRGPLENVTCENEYFTAAAHGRHWQNETVNEFHALYSPMQAKYRYGQTLRFKCPLNSQIHRTSGLTVMTTSCSEDAKWSQEWPMCKGRTCPYMYIKNGIINDKHKKLSPGITLDIKCKRGFYLWGPNHTTCLSTLRWSGPPQDCVTLRQFRKNCESKKKIMRIRHIGFRAQPYCYYIPIVPTTSNQIIAVGISIPMVVGFIIFIAAASCYVRKQRIKFARERELYLRQEQRKNLILKTLPSYEEVIKSKPTCPPPTFEEIFDVETRNPEEHTLLVVHQHSREQFTDSGIDAPPQYIESELDLQDDLPPHYSENVSLERDRSTSQDTVTDPPSYTEECTFSNNVMEPQLQQSTVGL